MFVLPLAFRLHEDCLQRFDTFFKPAQALMDLLDDAGFVRRAPGLRTSSGPCNGHDKQARSQHQNPQGKQYKNEDD